MTAAAMIHATDPNTERNGTVRMTTDRCVDVIGGCWDMQLDGRGIKTLRWPFGRVSGTGTCRSRPLARPSITCKCP